ncbi:DUF5708 family protein [Streptomyces sp. NPDC020412]|uniref:DUF5708 family protein n=1 Tax=Streptomyces sp. NPDC020412 TaxID=3365073 RepID=UPI003799971C
MKKSLKTLLEGGVTFATGAILRLTTEGVDTPVITLTKVGVVLMFIGGALLLTGLAQTARNASLTS